MLPDFALLDDPAGPFLRTTRNDRKAMFAVIAESGRQFRIQEGETFLIDYREGVEAGAAIKFEQVLLANGGGPSSIGTPAISARSSKRPSCDRRSTGPSLRSASSASARIRGATPATASTTRR